MRSFVAVARHLHFRRAAEELHLAQPAVSRQIQALERDLGVTLLERDPPVPAALGARGGGGRGGLGRRGDRRPGRDLLMR